MSGSLKNAQRQGLEDDITSFDDPSHMVSGSIEDGVDAEWLRFNILSLGCPICIPNLNLC